MTEIKQILEEYGLSEKEIKIYITLLSIGSSKVNEIAKRAELIRTTTYDLLKTLKEKGLVSFTNLNNKLYFQATAPERIILLLEEKKKKIMSILPELKKMHIEVSNIPAIKIYDGKEGIKSIYQDILNERKEISSFSNTHFIFNVLPFFTPNFIRTRMKNKIFIKLLNEKTKESLELMKNKDKKEMRETRFIDELKDIPITEYIYGDKVAILNTNPQDPLGILIKNKDFAKTQQLLFDLLWKKAEK
jgi:sugar-specific transcriptional regulator TrmB